MAKARRLGVAAGCSFMLVVAVALDAAAPSRSLASAPSPVTGLYAPVVLPADTPVLNGVDCVADSACFAVGGSGSSGAIESTGDGLTWTTAAAPQAAWLNSVTCPSPQRCWAVGASALDRKGGIVYATADGAKWTTQVLPVGTAALRSVSCWSSTGCMAVGALPGAQYRTGFRTSVVITRDGQTWVSATVPGTVEAVDCVAGGVCYASGGGVWKSADHGASWQDVAPPNQSLSGCVTTRGSCPASPWSELTTVQFLTASTGWVAGGDGCGGRGRTQCPGIVFGTTDGGSHWTPWTAYDSGHYPFVDAIWCDANAVCAAAGQTFTSSVLMSSFNGRNWPISQAVYGYLAGLSCAGSRFCLAVGGRTGRGIALLSNHAGVPPTAVAVAGDCYDEQAGNVDTRPAANYCAQTLNTARLSGAAHHNDTALAALQRTPTDAVFYAVGHSYCNAPNIGHMDAAGNLVIDNMANYTGAGIFFVPPGLDQAHVTGAAQLLAGSADVACLTGLSHPIWNSWADQAAHAGLVVLQMCASMYDNPNSSNGPLISLGTQVYQAGAGAVVGFRGEIMFSGSWGASAGYRPDGDTWAHEFWSALATPGTRVANAAEWASTVAVLGSMFGSDTGYEGLWVDHRPGAPDTLAGILAQAQP